MNSKQKVKQKAPMRFYYSEPIKYKWIRKP